MFDAESVILPGLLARFLALGLVLLALQIALFQVSGDQKKFVGKHLSALYFKVAVTLL